MECHPIRKGTGAFALLAVFFCIGILCRTSHSPSSPPVTSQPGKQARMADTSRLFLPVVLSQVGTVSAPITAAAGGTVSNIDKSITVVVPGGAVTGNCTLTLSSSSHTGPPRTSDPGLRFLLELTDGSGQPVASLAKPLIITLSYGRLNLNFMEEGRLAIYRRSPDGSWNELSTLIDAAQHTATSATAALSGFGLYGKPITKSGMIMAVAAGTDNDAYFLNVGGGSGDFFTIYKIPGGKTNYEKYLDMGGTVGATSGGGEDLDFDPVSGRFFATDGTNLWRVNADKTVTRLYRGEAGALGDAGVYGLFFDRLRRALYVVGSDLGVAKIDPDSGTTLSRYPSPPGVLHDVAVDAGGRLFAATWTAKRTSQSIAGGAWTDLYYWVSAGANSRWMPVAGGFLAGRGMAADASGNIFLPNWMEGSVSVIAGSDPSVQGFIRFGSLAAAAAVTGNQLLVSLSGSLVSVPASRRDAPPAVPTAQFPASPSLSGQGSLVTLHVAGNDPVPAHNVLALGGRVVHEIAWYEPGKIEYRLPLTSDQPDFDPLIREPLTCPGGSWSYLAGSLIYSGSTYETPDRGHFVTFPSSASTLEIATNSWVVWVEGAYFGSGAALTGVESTEGLFPKWQAKRTAQLTDRWLAYQFKSNGTYGFTFFLSNGSTQQKYVRVSTMGPSTWADKFRVQPSVGGSLWSQGAVLEIPPGALPGSSAYEISITRTSYTEPRNKNLLTAYGPMYSVEFNPVPTVLYRDLRLEMPYELAPSVTDLPQGAFWDNRMVDYVPLESTVTSNSVHITFPAGSWTTPPWLLEEAEAAGEPLPASGPARDLPHKELPAPGRALATRQQGVPANGQRLFGALSTAAQGLWWVAGLPTQQERAGELFIIYYHNRDTTREYVLTLKQAIQSMLSVMNNKGYRLPSPWTGLPPILIKIAPWVTGITNAEGMTPSCGTLSHYYVFMSNTLSTEKLKAAAAHELFHVLQIENTSYAGRIRLGRWFKDSTATWAEAEVFPDIKEYTDVIKRRPDFPRISMPNWDELGDDVYATGAFAIYLELKKPGSILKVLQSVGLTTDVMNALDSAVGGLDVLYRQFAQDYWLASPGFPLTQEADVLSGIKGAYDWVDITGPVTVVGQDAAGGLVSRIATVKVPNSVLNDPPLYFNTASGSVVRLGSFEPSGTSGSEVRLLDSSFQNIATWYSALPASDQGPVLRGALAGWTAANPVYYLFIHSRKSGGGQMRSQVETPAILAHYPIHVLVVQPFTPKEVTISLQINGYGPKEGRLAGARFTGAWPGIDGYSKSLGSTETIREAKVTVSTPGNYEICLETFEGVKSNKVTLLAVDGTFR